MFHRPSAIAEKALSLIDANHAYPKDSTCNRTSGDGQIQMRQLPIKPHMTCDQDTWKQFESCPKIYWLANRNSSIAASWPSEHCMDATGADQRSCAENPGWAGFRRFGTQGFWNLHILNLRISQAHLYLIAIMKTFGPTFFQNWFLNENCKYMICPNILVDIPED